ncbi:MAG: hypothetical protein Q7T50_04405 [Candidatus Magasanikbacteria bacterium]|nr:hypothetical protein [Candidatus Magasanikbacteria bacterium]
MHYKLAPLILTPGKNASTTSDVYIAQPDSIKESLAGKLFILIEIESKKQDSLKIINFLIDNINHNYYQNEKILLREKISTLKVEHIFEAALAKTNKNFSDMIQQEKIKINLDAINIITGIIYEDSIHFVNSGKNKAYLIYRHKVEGERKGKIKEDDIIEYKILDIIEQAGANKKKKNDEKLFTNVISGKIPKRGHFIITNEALPEYISTKQLLKIATTLPPISAVEQMKNTLSNINSYVSFLGILIKSTSIENEEKTENISNLSTRDSIASLNKTETNTENLLSASGVINPKQWMKVPDFINDKNKKIKNPSLEKPFVLKDKIFGKRKSSFSFLKQTLNFLKNSLYHLLNFAQYLSSKIKARAGNSSDSSLPPLSLPETSERKDIKEIITAKLKNLFTFPGLSSRKSKVLLTLAIIFICLFFINIYTMKDREAKKAKILQYENSIASIEKKQNQAEAFLLYNNKEAANQIFPEIKTLLDSLIQETDEQKAKYQELKTKYDLQNEKIGNVVRINNLSEITNLKNLSAMANGENIILSTATNKLYIADSAEKSIYTLNLGDNSVTTATDTGASISALHTPKLADDNKIYYLNQSSIIEFDASEKINKIAIDLGTATNNFSASANYNDKLYLLNTSESQIYKFNHADNTFNGGQTWLNSKVDLSNAVDISIDGNVYVLKNNGEILKFLKGNKVAMEMETINPPFTNATAFFNSSDSKFIYILEPVNQRLVIFDKNGKFIQQYVSSQFTNLKDFAVDEKNKTLYFLNDNSILKTTATHL